MSEKNILDENKNFILDKNRKAIFVIGATATGKSKVALDIAKKHNGLIINCDSIQFYKGLNIGSSAPTEFEKQQAPHFLYSYINPPTEMTAGEFLREFYKLIENENFKNKYKNRPLIIVGGTGFYVQALEKGMYNVPQIEIELKNKIENEIKEFGNEKAYQELIEFDPDTKIHVNDAYRIGRALEIKRAFNLKVSELKDQTEIQNSDLNTDSQTKSKLPFPFVKIGIELEKDHLIENIKKRTEQMLKQGLVEEVQGLIKNGLENWAPLSSVGYLETKDFLSGHISESELEQKINHSTYKLTKKQKTWFKRDLNTTWINPTIPEQCKNLSKIVDQFLDK